ncbi:MAG: hypothetical protein IH627_19715 [Rubrivivax sp.]|nr:hypothetical protein [Rubrivivax sp.]
MSVRIVRLVFAGVALPGLSPVGCAEQPRSAFPSRDVQIVVANEPDGHTLLLTSLKVKKERVEGAVN